MKRFLLVLLLFPLCLSASAAEKIPLFPETYPEEFKKMKLRDKDVRKLAPGVIYYRYHFDNVLPKGAAFYRLSHIFIKDGDGAAEKAKEACKKLRSDSFGDVARDYSDHPGAQRKGRQQNLSFGMYSLDSDALTPEMKAAVKGLRKPGDTTKPVKAEKGYYIFRLDKKVDKMPLSAFYTVIDWDKANVKFRLAGCGKKLKKVKDMVKEYNPIVAVNGAYFTWTPLATYYPFKVDGKLEMPPKGYDSKTGMCFNDGEFPVIDKEENYDKYDNVIVGYHVWSKGKYTVGRAGTDAEEYAKGDTPLTSIGFNYATKRIVLLVVDGRFPSESPGVNFYTESLLHSYMGCDEVLSIDGGGSCTMLIREGKSRLSDPVNHPSDNRKFDHEGARSVYNCVYVVDGDKK